MSRIQGKPFIEELVDSLSKGLRKDLLDLLNGTDKTPEFRSLVNKDHLITGSDKNKVQYIVLETFCKPYTGYLVYNNSYCVLIAFNNNTQALQLVNVDLTKNNCRLIKQPVDILELRMYLRDPTASTTVGEIDSGSALPGQVIAADGNGGATWENTMDTITPETVESGDAVQLFGFNAQGQLVKDDMPEGITVDSTVIEDSPNAVSGGGVYDALQDHYTKTEVDAKLEEKANVDGNYPTMTVGVADQLSPYDEESGDDQDEPFNFQATGTGNGTQPDFSTGAIALMKEKRGNTVVVNQLIYNRDFENLDLWENSGVSSSVSNGIVTLTNVSGDYGRIITYSPHAISGHTYITIVDVRSDNVTSCVATSGTGWKGFPISSSWQTLFAVGLCSSNFNSFVLGFSTGDIVGKTIQFKKPAFIDLTQWFNGDIPADLLSHPENFFRYYQGSLAYNTGTLVNANGRYVKCIGRNQWDEETEIVGGTYLRSKNFIKVVPGITYHFCYTGTLTTYPTINVYYYDEAENQVGTEAISANFGDSNVTIPNNATKMKFACSSALGTTYNHDITISLYYEDESGYDQYYPYEVLTNNDTGTETLRSAGNAHDIKLPSGEIKRNIFLSQNAEDMGLNRSDLDGSGTIFVFVYSYYAIYGSHNVIKKPLNNDGKANALFNGLLCVARNQMWSQDKCFSIQPDGQIIIRDDSCLTASDFTTKYAGQQFYLELDTPTTEQGTSYSENLVIDDFGSMDFQGTNGVPQGNLIFYPVDYKAFIDTLYDYTEGTPSNIALKSDLSAYQPIMQDLSSGIENIAGLTVQKAKAYKLGNLRMLTLELKNETGASIGEGANLMRVPQDMRTGATIMFTATTETTSALANVVAYISWDGYFKINSQLENNQYIRLYVCYAVA